MTKAHIKSLLFLSLAFLLSTVGVSNSSHYFLKSLFFIVGIIIALSAIIFSLIKKQHKVFLLPCAIMFMAYIILFASQFQVKTLENFIPSNASIEIVEIRPNKTTQSLVWNIDKSTLTYTDGTSIPVENEGSSHILEQARKLTLRDFWWPGAVESDIIFDLAIRFTEDNDDYSVSIYTDNNGITIYSRNNSDLVKENWITFGDIANILPQDILLLIE